ncbi:aspartate carbamoyltransferase [Candidatus Bipolaricaulota bacterium]|nr:aspartate carbamoyltransferase [Candidatus Bipolaricaulota bacterium]
MAINHFLGSLDFSPEKYDVLFSLASRIIDSPSDYTDRCRGKLMATLFYEPSTRTRLSFEAAMLRLGGGVISVASAKSSSVSKGESLGDTIRTVGGYADLIVMRHPKEGAALLAAEYSPVPLINGGDGAREHPTQTLTDLFTIHRFKGRFDGLTVAFCGDLRYGRTVHSLVKALARYSGVKFILISPSELRLPERIVREVNEINPEATLQETTSMEDGLESADVLYMTRIQKERFFNEEDYIRLRDTYILTEDKLRAASEEMIVMHPLPRVTEIDYAIDADPRAVYFEQARFGMFARMALIVHLLSDKEGGDA